MFKGKTHYKLPFSIAMLNCHLSSLSSIFFGSNTAPRKGPTDIYLHLLLQARTQFLSQHRWCSKSDWALPVWPPIAWQFGKNDMSFTKHWNTGRPPLWDFMNIPYFHSNNPSFERWVPVESSDRFTPDFIPLGPTRDAKVAIVLGKATMYGNRSGSKSGGAASHGSKMVSEVVRWTMAGDLLDL